MKKPYFALAAALSSANVLAAGSVVIDNTLPGHATNTTILPASGTYTIPASQGYVSSPTGATHNLFFSFQTFNIDTGETGLFTNDLAATYSSFSFANLVSRVTGGTPSIINGTIDSTAFFAARFWFVNPAGVTIGPGAVLNVPAGLAMGAADYVGFANGDRWYVIDGSAPTGFPSTLSTSNPVSFGFLPTPAAGALTFQGTAAQGTTVSPNGPLLLSAGPGGISLNYTTLQTDNFGEVASAGPGITLSTAAGGPIALQSSNVTTQTHSAGTAGDINITSGGALSLQNSNVQSKTFNFGNAGSVSLASTGTGATGTVRIVGGVISSTADRNSVQAGSIGNPGNVVIAGDSVDASGATVESVSYGSGTTGKVSIAGNGPDTAAPGSGAGDAVYLTANTVVASDAGGPQSPQAPGGVSIQAATGSIRIDAGSQVHSNTTSIGTPLGGPVAVSGAGGVTLDAASIQSSSTFNLGSSTTATPSTIQISSSGGPITLSSGTAVSSTTGAAYEPSDNIVISTPGAVTLSGGSVLTTSGEPVGSIGVTGGSIHVTGSDVDVLGVGQNGAATTPGGNLTLTATGADAGATPALLVDGGSRLNSSTSVGHAGNVSLSAAAGTLSIVGNPAVKGGGTTISASADSFGDPGTVFLSGSNVSLNGALIEASTTAHAGPANAVNINATGAVSMVGSLIDTEASSQLVEYVPGGNIAITGGSVSITGGQQPGTNPSLPANTALSSGSNSLQGQGGSLLIASTGPVTLQDATLSTQSGFNNTSGSISVAGSGVLISQQSLLTANFNSPGGFPGGPGSIAVRATGTAAADDPLQGNLTTATPGVVRIVDSGVTAINNGGVDGNTAGVGQIWIGADLPGGSTALADDVVIAGSVLSTDVLAGGRGNNITIEANHGVWIGASSTGGYADPLASAAFPDPRSATTPALQVTGNSRSLISAQTETSAVSGGQILIQAGDRGVTIVSSNVDGNDQVSSNSAGSSRSSSNITIAAPAGPVSLSDAVVQTETAGVNKAGDIDITGGSVSLSGGELSASSTAVSQSNNVLYDVGDAGSVSVTATQATGPNGSAALQVNGAILQSSAATAAAVIDPQSGRPAFAQNISDGVLTPVLLPDGSPKLAIPNAGTVTLAAGLGSVQLTGSTLSTAAGVNAGYAGTISVSAAKGNISTTGSTTNTNVASAWTLDDNGNPIPYSVATISMGAPAGNVTLSGTSVTADTSGTIPAGTIDITAGGALSVTGGSGSLLSSRTSASAPAGNLNLTGSSVSLSGADFSAKTTGTGVAGNINITATGADPQGGVALSISGGTQISSDATGGQSAAANAGTIVLAAASGTIRVGSSTDSSASLLSSAAGPNAGAPGTVTLTGAGIDLEDAQISTAAAGAQPATIRGTIVLNAGQGAGALTVANSSLDAATSGAQQAGEIDLNGAPITIGNSNISSRTTGTGAAGAICVSSSGACLGSAATAGASGGRTAAVLPRATAVTGSAIDITASTLSTSTSTSGNGGNINILSGGALDLTGAAVESKSTSTAANAGAVGVITLSGCPVNITGGSAVLATSLGGTPGAATPTSAAAITINCIGANCPIVVSNSTIATTAAVTNGSNIVVNAGGSPVLLTGSVVTASATAGNGGNITVNDAGNTILAGSAIVAQAGPGNGGAINIGLKKGGLFVQDSGSLVSATSQTGNNGTVTINSPQTDLNAALILPEVRPARAPELAANACARDSDRSTFVVEGSGGVAPTPDGYLIGHVPAANATAAANADREPTLHVPSLLAAVGGSECH